MNVEFKTRLREQLEGVQSDHRLEPVEAHPNVYEHFPLLESGLFHFQIDFHLAESHSVPLGLGLGEHRFSTYI